MRIFIVCPANIATGGTELLHQFAKCLNDYKIENYMIYLDASKTVCPTPEVFLKYGVSYVSQYIDAEDSVLVLPETRVHLIDWCKRGTAMVWWLSVDNYIESYEQMKQDNGLDFFHLRERENVLHFVQSHYAKDFLKKQLKIEKTYFLMDYINDEIVEYAEFYQKSFQRKNRCLYNPTKGYEVLKPIIEECRKDIEWVPLIGLKPREMTALMCSSKLYVDFGKHPGKDRIPREAAVCGLCVLTGCKGSAAYEEDVNIPKEYKVEDTENISNVLESIYDLVDNYEEKYEEYSDYRQQILGEKVEFIKDTAAAVILLKEHIKEETEIRKNPQNNVYSSIIGAIDKMSQLASTSKALYEEGNVSDAVQQMLNMDYIMQIVRETIYIQLSDMTSYDEEDV